MRYDEWFDKNKFVYESELEAIRCLLPKRDDGIEIGVGSGRFAAPLGIKFGIEPSQKMVHIARSRDILTITGAAESLPLKSSIFDYVLMVTTICFLDNVEKALREIHRVVKTGGFLLIGFIDIESSLDSFYKAKKDNPFYREASFYSTYQVISHIKKAGFEHFSFRQTIFDALPSIKWLQPIKKGYGQGAFVVIRGTK